MLLRLVVLMTTLWSVGAHAAVEFKIVTADGYVAFSVEEQWPVLKTSTAPPIMTFAFQLPNAADEGTPDSSNLAIQFFDLNDSAAREAYQRIGAAIETALPQRVERDGWTIDRQTAHQGETLYTIIDAKRDLRSLSCAVRLAWPALSKNSGSYDGEMERALDGVLDSIRQHVGHYKPDPNEIMRRKSQ